MTFWKKDKNNGGNCWRFESVKHVRSIFSRHVHVLAGSKVNFRGAVPRAAEHDGPRVLDDRLVASAFRFGQHVHLNTFTTNNTYFQSVH